MLLEQVASLRHVLAVRLALASTGTALGPS